VDELTVYARNVVLDETRRGLTAMSVLALALLAAEALLYVKLELGGAYLWTCALLAVFAVHVAFSARAIKDLPSLYLLGTTMLVVSGMAFVLLAHQTGAFHISLFASIALLFMVIPMVPWGLREALTITVIIYGMLTASTWGVTARFEYETLWTLQLLMVGAGMISLALVARNVSVRRGDIETRFNLEKAHKRILILSHKDPLTGAWNRRYLKGEFAARLDEWRLAGRTFHFAFLDVDDFKALNDTYGHDYGDSVLQWVTTEFNLLLEDKGCLVRMGGDEFALLFADDDPERLIAVGLEAVRALAGEHGQQDPVEISFSVGLVTVNPDLELAQDAVYREADTALYAAKDRKGQFSGRVNIVSRTLRADAMPEDRRRFKVAGDILN
jgi:diguanylate cyclase (GGDEF)-like protein